MIAPLDKRNRRIENAARIAAERDRKHRDDPEPTVASRLGQIGVLGWAIVAPILLCMLLGRWLDGTLKTGVFLTAPLIVLGAAAGFWTAWRWMHRQ